MDHSNIRLAKLQKERELMALQQVSFSIEELKQKLESMVEKFQSVEEGAEAVKTVLSNWNDVKRVISMATLGLANYSEEDYNDPSKLPLAEGAVRVFIDNQSGKEKDEEEEEAFEEEVVEKDEDEEEKETTNQKDVT